MDPGILYTIAICASCALNVSIHVASGWNKFIRGVFKYCRNCSSQTICSRNENGKITSIFQILTIFIDKVIKQQNEQIYQNCSQTIEINNKVYTIMQTTGFITIDFKVSKKRKEELGLWSNNITFWIYADGQLNNTPVSYEVLIINSKDMNKSQISDVYRLLILFCRDVIEDDISIFNLINMYRINNIAIRNETYKKLIEYNNKVIELEVNRIKERITQIDWSNFNNVTNASQLLTNMNNFRNTFSSIHDILAICYKHPNIICQSPLTNIQEMENFINESKRNYGEFFNRTVISVAILNNFEIYFKLLISKSNLFVLINDTSLNQILTLNRDKQFEFFIQNINRLVNYPLINKILLNIYLEISINKNANLEEFSITSEILSKIPKFSDFETQIN